MKPFVYARPETVEEAVALLDRHGPSARVLAGGTDLIIELRNHDAEPDVVVDVKRIPELASSIAEVDGSLRITASTVMTDIVENDAVQRHFPALAEGAVVVGSVQIRARATLVGNICNGSPAADTSPPLLVYGATVHVAGPGGRRPVPIDDFIVGPGTTALERGEMVTAIDLPIPAQQVGSAYERLVRRRGTDLASITLCCAVEPTGTTRLAYGSVGPRAFLVSDQSGLLADPHASAGAKDQVFERLFSLASPSLRSLRASPAYRLAMLRVLGARALDRAIGRLAKEPVA